VPSASSRTVSGFTAVETLVAIAILSLMGLLIGNTLIRTTQAVGSRDDRSRAAALASMVFEQYKSYASINFDELPSHDQTDAAPRAFFNTADDLGYDGLLITTHTQCASDGSACTVQAVIRKSSGKAVPPAVFSQTYVEASLGDTAKEESGI